MSTRASLLRAATRLVFALVLASPALAQPAAPAAAPSGFGPWAESERDLPAMLKYATFPSRLAGADVSYVVYLPPGYDADRDRRYPVVYWLHGRGGSANGASAFASRLDVAIKAGKAPAMIVVGVNGRRISSWVDAADGTSPVQSVIIQELIPHVDATYRTVATREGRAVEGFSMGGAGAPKLGLKFPELFGAVSAISGALHTVDQYASRGNALAQIYGGSRDYYLANDAWTLAEKNAAALRDRTFIRVAVGDRDNLQATVTAFHEALTRFGLTHDFDVVPGAEHNPAQVYDGLGDKTWDFYRRAFARSAATSETHPAAPAPTAPPAPTVADLAYGSHPRQVLHLWVARSDRSTPFALFFHGGGFIDGDRSELNPAELQRLLAAGISVAAVEYRVLSFAKLPAAHQDAARALQFLRANAAKWNLDPSRAAAFGGSAGAQLAMYLAFHDDLADPRSDDPIARQSTRLTCVAPSSGQVTMDMNWWREHVPDALAGRTPQELYGTADETAARQLNADLTALTLISADDPPVFMTFGFAPGTPYPADERRARGMKIHHVVHGETLKKLCDQLGVEAHLKYPGATTAYASGTDFLIAKLTRSTAPNPVAATEATTRAPANPAARGTPNNAPNAWTGIGKIDGWQNFTVKTEDGVETPALWVAPEGKGPFPAIVWFHGAPAAQGEAGERAEADRARFDLFLKAGFVVCLGDYRARSPEGSTLTAADDAIAIIRHVKSLPLVDPARVAATGHSLGGATNLLAVSREPVACVAVSASAAYGILGLPMGSMMGKPPGGALAETEYDKPRALGILRTIDAPVFIFYGEADPLSRVNKTLHELLLELHKDVKLATYPGEHHGMLFRPNDRERGLRAWTTLFDFVSGVLQPTR
ncbi:MAG: alpha/beta hydrolase-fold protein [Nocardioides sp.]